MHNDLQPTIKVPDGYTIKRVPFGLLSDSVFTPDLPLRATQTTIGYFLGEKKSSADDSYGVHKSKYGGTGETNRVLGEYEMIPVRKTNSLRTALHASPQPPMTEKIMAKRILENKSFFAGPINEVGCDVFQLATESQRLPLPAPKQLFPRSVVYEIEYVKEKYRKAMMDALEKERKEFEEFIKKQKQALKNEKTGEKKEEIFKEKDEGTEIMKGVCSFQEAEKQKEAENQKEKEALPCTSVCGLCGCTLTRGACPKCDIETESLNLETIFDKANVRWKPERPKYGSSWGERRQAEMMKVNYPFKTEAARWYYQTFLPIDTSAHESSKTKFPENRFSSVNI